MKKISFFIILCALVYSCKPNTEPIKAPTTNRVSTEVVGESLLSTLSIITVDSCEYLVYKGSDCVSMIHKQNCKNHKY